MEEALLQQPARGVSKRPQPSADVRKRCCWRKRCGGIRCGCTDPSVQPQDALLLLEEEACASEATALGGGGGGGSVLSLEEEACASEATAPEATPLDAHSQHAAGASVKAVCSETVGGNVLKSASRPRLWWSRVRLLWTRDQDKLIMQHVQRHGTKSWALVASHISGRTGQQVRKRWDKHLEPSIRKDPCSRGLWYQALAASLLYADAAASGAPAPPADPAAAAPAAPDVAASPTPCAAPSPAASATGSIDVHIYVHIYVYIYYIYILYIYIYIHIYMYI